MSLKIFKNSEGTALLITLALIALLTGVVLMSADRSSTDIELSYNQLHEEQSFYIAEAGMERAVAVIKNNQNWRTGFANEPLGDGLYSVAVVDSTTNPALSDTIVLMATSTVGTSSANLEAWMVFKSDSPYKRASFGELRIYIHDGACTDSYNSDSGTYFATMANSGGDVGSNVQIEIRSSSVVNGDVATANPGDIIVGGTATINGDTTSTAPSTPMNLVSQSDYDWAQANNSRYTGMSGDVNFGPGPLDLRVDDDDVVTLESGTYYFTSIFLDDDSKIKLAPGAEVKIYVEGTINLESGSDFNENGKPTQMFVFTKGSIVDLEGNSEFKGALYAPNADFVHYSSGAGFYGAVIARRVEVKNSACIHFDRALSNIQFGAGSGYDVIAWRQKD